MVKDRAGDSRRKTGICFDRDPAEAGSPSYELAIRVRVVNLAPFTALFRRRRNSLAFDKRGFLVGFRVATNARSINDLAEFQRVTGHLGLRLVGGTVLTTYAVWFCPVLQRVS